MNRYSWAHIKYHIKNNPLTLSQQGGVDSWHKEECNLYKAYKEAASQGLPLAKPDGVHYFGNGDVQEIADCGFKWVRFEFLWEQMAWATWDSVVGSLVDKGINILGILGYDNASHKTYDADFAGYFIDEYASKIIKKYGDRIKHWEVFNEPFWSFPNRSNWQGQTAQYVSFMKVATGALRILQPGLVFMNSLAGRRSDKNIRIIEDLKNIGLLDCIDTFNFHEYYSDLNDVCVLIEWIKANVNKILWVTEYGVPESGKIDWCRSREWCYKHGGIDKSFWFCWNEIKNDEEFYNYLREVKKNEDNFDSN